MTLAGCPSAPPPSVVVIVVDTLRVDHVGSLRADGRTGPDATPRLDRFADGAAAFRHAYTPAPFTMPAMAAAMTGAWPDRTSVIAHEPGVSLRGWKGQVLAEAARRSGLATAAVVANPWLARGATGFDRGFDRFVRLPPGSRGPGANSATAVTDEAIRLLDAVAGRRFLLWVHYFDPHMPYTPPRRFAEAASADGAPSRVMADFQRSGRDLAALYRGDGYTAGELDQARRLYEGEVRYVDDEIGRLLDHVAERDGAGGTVVVVASDHGEALGEHGLHFAHDYTLYDELLHVPLLVKGPGVPAVTRDDAVSLVDLAPTICRLVALQCDAVPDGRDLFAAPAPSRTLFAAATPRRSKDTPFAPLDVDGPEGRWTMALREGIKLVRMPSSRGTTFESYDLARDPGEVHDLAGAEAGAPGDAQAAAQLRATLDEWMREMDAARPPAGSPGRSAHFRSRERDTKTLRSLGYLQ